MHETFKVCLLLELLFQSQNLKHSVGNRVGDLTDPWGSRSMLPPQIHPLAIFLADLNRPSKGILVLWLSGGPPSGKFQRRLGRGMKVRMRHLSGSLPAALAESAGEFSLPCAFGLEG